MVLLDLMLDNSISCLNIKVQIKKKNIYLSSSELKMFALKRTTWRKWKSLPNETYFSSSMVRNLYLKCIRTQELSHPMGYSLSWTLPFQSLGSTLACREDVRDCSSRYPLPTFLISLARGRNWWGFLLDYSMAWGQNCLPMGCRVFSAHTRDSCFWNHQIGQRVLLLTVPVIIFPPETIVHKLVMLETGHSAEGQDCYQWDRNALMSLEAHGAHRTFLLEDPKAIPVFVQG